MNTVKKEPIDDLEQILQASLHPVAPRQEFISQLRRRLSESVILNDQKSKTQVNATILLGLAALLSGTFIFLTASRLILAIVGAIGVARFVKQEADQKKFVTRRI